jgi:hypothetical protein
MKYTLSLVGAGEVRCIPQLTSGGHKQTESRAGSRKSSGQLCPRGTTSRPNFTLELARPGFGPSAEPPRPNPRAAALCRLQIARRCPAMYAATCLPHGFGTRALAAQLSVRSVRRSQRVSRVR